MNPKNRMPGTVVFALGVTFLGMSLLPGHLFGQTTPAPAYGQDPTPPPVTQAPPVTSLDEPSLEPSAAARSYLQPGAHVTETINSNLSNSGSGSNGVVGITRALGSLDLKRLWSRYDLSLNYTGGLAVYSDAYSQPSQVHSLDASQRYSWRTGQIQLRDGLTYLPEGSFGFSGFSLGGSGSGGGAGGTFGTLGSDPRLTNAAAVDVRESLSPRTSVTFGGGYSFTDFLGAATNSTSGSIKGTVNSHEVSGEAGLNRILNRFDQVGVSYGYQEFQFPIQGAGSIRANVIQLLYAHQISGRMSLILGAGPQFTHISARTDLLGNPVPATNQLNANIRASLKYRFTRTSTSLTYSRYTSSGSGLQLGSNSDVARVLAERPLNRLWTGTADVGYSRHSALQAGLNKALGGTYQTGFGGGGVSRRLGRFFSMSLHYQYSYEYFGGAACGQIDCNHSFNRHLADVTVSWHPQPIRLD